MAVIMSVVPLVRGVDGRGTAAAAAGTAICWIILSFEILDAADAAVIGVVVAHVVRTYSQHADRAGPSCDGVFHEALTAGVGAGRSLEVLEALRHALFCKKVTH